METIFTDYQDMVGKRPREQYWSELQEAVIKMEGTVNELTHQSREPKQASAPIQDYEKGVTVFEVKEDISSGYPTLDGFVETLIIDEFRNIQHFFDYPTSDKKVGHTYTRQWRPALNAWTNFARVLNENDLTTHAGDIGLHITPVDRVRLDGFMHSQVAESDTWTISHNLGRYPQVTIMNSGNQIIIGDVKYITNDVVQITFTEPIIGRVILN